MQNQSVCISVYKCVCVCVCVCVSVCVPPPPCIHLKASAGRKRPHSWKASSSVRDISSLASSSELMSSTQVSSCVSRWRSSILLLEPWVAEVLTLSDRTRRGGLPGNRNICSARAVGLPPRRRVEYGGCAATQPVRFGAWISGFFSKRKNAKAFFFSFFLLPLSSVVKRIRGRIPVPVPAAGN